MSHWSRGHLRIGSLHVTLAGCEAWDPSPKWDEIKPEASLLNALDVVLGEIDGDDLDPIDRDLLTAVRGNATRPDDADALQALRLGLQHADPGRFREVSQVLLGRGGGLTPAGDDLLLGVEVAIWLRHPHAARSLCAALIEGAERRTTTLSCAFLESAARGELREAWHILLEERSHSAVLLQQHLRRIMAYGASSGLFTLIGFRLALKAMGGDAG